VQLAFQIAACGGKRRDLHILSNVEKEKWIEEYVNQETAVAKKQVEDSETPIQQEQDDMRSADIVGLTARKSEETYEGLLNAIGDSLSDIGCFDDGEDGEDEDNYEENSEPRKLGEDDDPRWVMSTITKTVQHCMEMLWLELTRLDELTQP